MARSRDKDGVEFWRGKHRELLKENRNLRKQLKQLEKYERTYIGQDDADTPSDSEDTLPKSVNYIPCPNCGGGKLRHFELIGRVYEECNECNYRKKLNG